MQENIVIWMSLVVDEEKLKKLSKKRKKVNVAKTGIITVYCEV